MENPDRLFMVFMAVFFIGTLGEKLVMPVIPIYFVDVLNLSYTDVGSALGIYGPSLAIAGCFIWSWAIKRFNPLSILTVCMFMKSLRPFLWGGAVFLSEPLIAIKIGEAIFKFAIVGLEMAGVLAVLEMAPSDRVVKYMGIHYWLMGLCGIGGPCIGYILLKLNVNFFAIFMIVGTTVIAGGIALLFFIDNIKRRQKRKLHEAILHSDNI